MRNHFLKAASPKRLSFSAPIAAYLASVEAADGSSLEAPVYNAMGTYAEFLYPIMSACCILSGARTLAGCLIPLVGPTPTPISLVAGDYNRSRLLGGGGKIINTGWDGSGNGLDNISYFAYARAGTFEPSTSGAIMGNAGSGSISQLLTTGSRSRAGASDTFSTITGQSGFYGASRNNSSNYDRILPSESTISVITSTSVGLGDRWCVYARTTAGNLPSPSSLCVYGIGPATDLVALRAASIDYDNALIATGL